MTALCDRVPELNDSLAAWALQDLRQCQPPHGQATNLQKVTPGVTIAIRRGFLAEDRKHGVVLS